MNNLETFRYLEGRHGIQPPRVIEFLSSWNPSSEQLRMYVGVKPETVGNATPEYIAELIRTEKESDVESKVQKINGRLVITSKEVTEAIAWLDQPIEKIELGYSWFVQDKYFVFKNHNKLRTALFAVAEKAHDIARGRTSTESPGYSHVNFEKFPEFEKFLTNLS